MPAHAEALNDLSSMPPVSVTMQPRVLPAAAAPLPEPAAGLEEPEPDGAELVLLPHAAVTTDADTASAAVAHALCFTLTSTGPARYCAWPRIRPRLTRRLFLVVSAGKGTRGLLACSLPNRNPIMMAVLAWQTEIRGVRAGSLLPSYKPVRLQAGEVLRGRRVLRARVVRPCVVRPCVVRCWHAGEFEDGGQPAARGLGQLGRAAVRGDQAVHDGQAESGAVRIGGGEAQEGTLPVFCAHARSAVGHRDPCPGRERRRGHGHVPSRAERVERVGDEVVENLLQVAFAHPGQHRRARPPPGFSAHSGLTPSVPRGPGPFA